MWCMCVYENEVSREFSMERNKTEIRREWNKFNTLQYYIVTHKPASDII